MFQFECCGERRTFCHRSIFFASSNVVLLPPGSTLHSFDQINFHLRRLKVKTISFIEVEEKFVNILKIKLNCVNFCSHNINFVRIKMKLIICLVSRQILIIHNSNNADCHRRSSRCYANKHQPSVALSNPVRILHIRHRPI